MGNSNAKSDTKEETKKLSGGDGKEKKADETDYQKILFMKITDKFDPNSEHKETVEEKALRHQKFIQEKLDFIRDLHVRKLVKLDEPEKAPDHEETLAKEEGGGDDDEDPAEKKKKLLEKKSKQHRYSGKYPLHAAAEAGETAVVKFLFDLGVRVDCSDKIMSTPLHRAVAMGHKDIVKQLLEYNANVHTVNKIGNTALHIASMWGHTDIARLLLSASAYTQINKPNYVMMTPLDYARSKDMKMLLMTFRPEDSKTVDPVRGLPIAAIPEEQQHVHVVDPQAVAVSVPPPAATRTPSLNIHVA